MNDYPASGYVVAIEATDVASDPILLEGCSVVRLINDGKDTCFVSLAETPIAATVPNGTPRYSCAAVLSQQDRVMTPVKGSLYLSAICRPPNGRTILLVEYGAMR